MVDAIVSAAVGRSRGVVVVAATPGTGKSEIALRRAGQTNGQHILYLVPFIELADELIGRYLDMGGTVMAPIMAYKGRSQPGMCPAGLGDFDGSIAADDQACGRLDGPYCCPIWKDGKCPYQQQKEAYRQHIAGPESITIAAHAYASLPGALAKPDFVIIDERFEAIEIHEIPLAEIERAIAGSPGNLVKLGTALRSGRKVSLVDVFGPAGADRLLADLQARLAAITGRIFPGCSAATVAAVKRDLAISPLPSAIRFAQALRDDLADQADYLQLVRFADLPGRPNMILVAERRMPVCLEGVPAILLDGTANERLIEPVWGPIRRFARASVDHVAEAKFVMRSGSRNSLVGPDAEAERAWVSRLVTTEAAGRPMLVFASKPVVEMLDLPPDAVRSYYGGSDRGLDRHGSIEFMAAIGRDMPSLIVAELRATALLFGSGKTIVRATEPVTEIRYQRTRKQGLVPIKVQVHPDPFVQAIIEQARECSVLQALHRPRPISNRNAALLFVGSLCLDLVVDEVIDGKAVTWSAKATERLAELPVIPIAQKHRGLVGLGRDLVITEDQLAAAHPGGRWIEYREAPSQAATRVGKALRAWCPAGTDDEAALVALKAIGINAIWAKTAPTAPAIGPALVDAVRLKLGAASRPADDVQDARGDDMESDWLTKPTVVGHPSVFDLDFHFWQGWASAGSEQAQQGEDIQGDPGVGWQRIDPWSHDFPENQVERQALLAAGKLRLSQGEFYRPARPKLSQPGWADAFTR